MKINQLINQSINQSWIKDVIVVRSFTLYEKFNIWKMKFDIFMKKVGPFHLPTICVPAA